MSFSQLVTNSTFPTAISANQRIAFVVEMAFRAMSFSRMSGRRRIAPKDVFFIGDWLHVVWVHTWRITAQVVQNQLVRNGAYQQNPGNAMGLLEALFKIKLSVAFPLLVTPTTLRSRPDPTVPSSVYLAPKSLHATMRIA